MTVRRAIWRAVRLWVCAAALVVGVWMWKGEAFGAITALAAFPWVVVVPGVELLTASTTARNSH